MTSQNLPPLVGPVRRRGVREMLRLAPLADLPHTALVITRRGGLVGIIPAGGRRALSDYFDLPCEVREVDMRERPLVIARQCDSAEPGYAFTVTLQIAYQVARPEHVALAHVDVVAELEEAIDQRARAVAATLTVEQASVLKAYLVEALVTGNELPQRFTALGLALKRVDVAVELGESERSYAEAVRDQTRDRPLLARFRVDSREADSPFDTQVGGFYRLSSRKTEAGYTAAEEIIYDIVARALARVGVSYTPEQYAEAARAMTEHLWTDGVLKAELAGSEIELLRPAVHIYPDRALLERIGRPLMLEDGRRREPRVRRLAVSPRLALAAPRDESEPAAPVETPSWHTAEGEVVEAEVVAAHDDSWISEWRAQHASADDEVSYSLADDDALDAAAAAAVQASPMPDDEPDDPGGVALEPVAVEAVVEPELVAVALVDAGVDTEEAEPVARHASAAAEPEPAAAEPEPVAVELVIEQEPATVELERAVGAPDVAVVPAEPPADPALVEQLVALLLTGGPALYKLWALELGDTPEHLPEIIRTLTADAELIDGARRASVQRAVVAAAQGPAPRPEARVRPAASMRQPVQNDERDIPDWMQLRETAVGESADSATGPRGGGA